MLPDLPEISLLQQRFLEAFAQADKTWRSEGNVHVNSLTKMGAGQRERGPAQSAYAILRA